MSGRRRVEEDCINILFKDDLGGLNMVWAKKTATYMPGYPEWDFSSGKYLISVRSMSVRNRFYVQVFKDGYGGYIADSPKSFDSKPLAFSWVKGTMKKLDAGIEGRKMAWND